tara:strand:- start:326 stop:904 length:579 start_codon:yes stop_codon:yes gene_type:complete
MARNKPKPVLYRRKRENKTNYSKRLHLLLANKLRLVVRTTNNRVIGQIIEFTPQGDKVLVGVNSFTLKDLGWKYSCKNFPAAYLTGLLLGKKAQEKGLKEAVLDTGFTSPLKKGKIYAFLKGVVDSGLDIPHSESIIPDEKRISGEHIKDYALTLKENKEVYELRFAQYLKNKVQPEEIMNGFEEIKKKIMG